MDIVDYYQKNPLFYSEHKEPISLGNAFAKDRTGMRKWDFFFHADEAEIFDNEMVIMIMMMKL